MTKGYTGGELDMKGVIVVIPVYKGELSLLEKISLRQVEKILSDYPIALMLPEKLEGLFENQKYLLEYFPNEKFESRLAYSKLLLEPDFYQRFSEYDYMLLYQLDAFVFMDKLKEFCAMGYDYIGAPMPYSCWRDIKANVGNGGFSLRKISSCIRVLSQKTLIYKMSGMKNTFERAEDKFFGYCGANDSIDFAVPKVVLAEKFAVEYNVAHSWQRMSSKNLPFGCHAWSKPQYYNFWRKYIKNFIEKSALDLMDRLVFASGKMSYHDWYFGPIYAYLNERFYRNQNLEQLNKGNRYSLLWEQIFPIHEKCVLWGYGEWGKKAFYLIKKLGGNVVGIFDQGKCGVEVAKGIICQLPDTDWIRQRNFKIIVTTVIYEKEIAELLQANGLMKEDDFYLFSDIEREFIAEYYKLIWRNMKESVNII